jgi:hypothetical protein
MRTILSIGLAALAASASAAASTETIVVVLEFGPGGSVHRTTSTASAASSPAAVATFWNVLHRPSSSQLSSKRAPSMGQHAGMSVVPDLFARPDTGVVIGLRAESLKSMPNAASLLLDESANNNVVGRLRVPGSVGMELVKLASPKADAEVVEVGDDAGRRLLSTAEAAARGEPSGGDGIEALLLVVDAADADAAAAADEQLRRMLTTLKGHAAANGKTVVLHLIVEQEGGAAAPASTSGRRLQEEEDANANANANTNSYSSNQKSMYEIQSFNLYLWTSVGLFVVVAMVMSAFIDMPLFPDTLLFGEAGKMSGSD